MPNSAATSVTALPLLSQSSTACCLKVLSNFFRGFLDSITGVFIQVVAFGVFLYLCPIFRAGPKRQTLKNKTMMICKDIPVAKDLGSKTLIDIKTETGIVPLYVFQFRRGDGTRKWCLSIDGIVKSEVAMMKQCYVFYKGAEIGGNFSKVKETNGIWSVTFET